MNMPPSPVEMFLLEKKLNAADVEKKGNSGRK